MAKVPKRISILASDEIADLPELVELGEKGHEVTKFSEFGECMDNLDAYDLILSRSACAYLPGMEKWLPDMVKGARARRYGVVKAMDTEV